MMMPAAIKGDCIQSADSIFNCMNFFYLAPGGTNNLKRENIKEGKGSTYF